MNWFIGLPIAVQITVGVVAILTIGVIAYLGKVNIKFGKNIITFGRAKRSCGDCILLIMAKRERMESQRNFVLTRVLKEQMNFAEQKLLEVQGKFLNSYRAQLHELKTNDISETEINKQYRLYQGILSMSLMSVKDEFRRSFKENGFEDLSGPEFTHYIKDKLQTLVSIGRDHLFNLYPYDGMLVSIDKRTEWLDSNMGQMEDILFEVYVKAKEIKIDSRKKAKSIEEEFSKEMDELIATRG